MATQPFILHRDGMVAGIAAPSLAALGYKPVPTLDTTILGGIGYCDKFGNIKSKHMFDTQIREAYSTALTLLAEQGITTPDRFLTPSLLPGNSFDKDGMTIKMWVVDMGSLDWGKSGTRFSCPSLNNGKLPADGTSKPNLITLNYAADTPRSVITDGKDMAITLHHYGNGMYINDSSCEDLAAFEAKIQDQYLIYELAEPLYIPFSQPLNLTYSGSEYNSLQVALDMEGKPMTQVHTIEVYSGGIPNATSALYRKASAEETEIAGITYVDEIPSSYKKYHFTYTEYDTDWVKANNQYPVGAIETLAGLGITYNAALLDSMLARIAALEGAKSLI